MFIHHICIIYDQYSDKEITCNKHTASQNPLLATGCGITGIDF